METFMSLPCGGSDSENLRERLERAGVRFNPNAELLFRHPLFQPGEPSTVTLVKLSPASLGWGNTFSLEQALERARHLGLEPCPLALAAFLRLAYLEQPPGAHLTVASERLEADPEFPAGLYLRNHEGSLWLRGYRAEGECEWPPGNEFIFAKPA